MRNDPVAFRQKNLASSTDHRFVVMIEFPTSSIYFTSHLGITGVPGIVVDGSLKALAAFSQRVIPDQGRAEIGAISFSAVDLAGAISAELRARLLTDNYGVNKRKVRVYVGFAGDAFADFQVFQTQAVRDVAYHAGGRYDIRCTDLTREQRKDIFDVNRTTLRDSINATATVIPVYLTWSAMVAHGAGWTDAPSSTVGYLKIQDEIIRYTGFTGDTFTGCTRGALNSKAVSHEVDAGTQADQRMRVEEFIYLELPAVKALYAILTGVLYGQGGATLPSHWHLGIAESDIRLADFTGIGVDLWDTASESNGVAMRFEGLTKTDGKRFVEEQIHQPLGTFAPVYADGTLGLRRMAPILDASAAVLIVDDDDVISHGDLTYDVPSMQNVFNIEWNYLHTDQTFSRKTVLIDAGSIGRHGRAMADKTMKWRGMHSARATDSTLRKRIDAMRDRFAEPPLRLRLRGHLSLNPLEVGDVVRLRLSTLRNFARAGAATATIDQAMEIQQITMDMLQRMCELELLGSTARASVVTPTSGNALPDAAYDALGSALSTVTTISAGVIQPGTYNINGGTDMNAAPSIFYYLGDLTLDSGATLNITGNVQIRVRGFFTVNGVINGNAGGKAGISDPGTPSGWPLISGTSGYLGNTRGGDGLDLDLTAQARSIATSIPIALTQGLHAAAPFLDLRVSGNSLIGLPSDLRGTSGGPGGRLTADDGAVLEQAGPAGGASGAGLVIVTRGMSFGASASITLNGGNGGAPISDTVNGIDVRSGVGAAGAPGALYILLDGSQHSVPNITGKFFASIGTATPQGVPIPNNEFVLRPSEPSPRSGFHSQIISAIEMSNVAHRIQYVPATQTPAADAGEKPPAPTSLFVDGLTGANIAYWSNPKVGFVTELWASTNNNRVNAVKVAEVVGTFAIYSLPSGGQRWHWVRNRNDFDPAQPIYSDWYPASATAGVPATAIDPLSFSASIAPTSDVESAASSSHNFGGSVVATVVPGTGSISYSWGFQNQVNGTFSIQSGQGTNTVTVSVSGVGPEQVATAELFCDVTREGVLKRTNISTHQFTNTTPNEVVNFGVISLSRDVQSPGDAHVSFEFNANGRYYTSNIAQTPNVDQGTWMTGGTPSNYEIMISRTGGSETNFTSGPALDVWHGLEATRTWVLSVTVNANQVRDISFTITIRKKTVFTPSLTRTGNYCYAEVFTNQ